MSRFAGGAGSLLDFACGRGGDIWKWIDAGILRVKGIDLSPGEIEEARKRCGRSLAEACEAEGMHCMHSLHCIEATVVAQSCGAACNQRCVLPGPAGAGLRRLGSSGRPWS